VIAYTLRGRSLRIRHSASPSRRVLAPLNFEMVGKLAGMVASSNSQTPQQSVLTSALSLFHFVVCDLSVLEQMP